MTVLPEKGRIPSAARKLPLRHPHTAGRRRRRRRAAPAPIITSPAPAPRTNSSRSKPCAQPDISQTPGPGAQPSARSNRVGYRALGRASVLPLLLPLLSCRCSCIVAFAFCWMRLLPLLLSFPKRICLFSPLLLPLLLPLLFLLSFPKGICLCFCRCFCLCPSCCHSRRESAFAFASRYPEALASGLSDPPDEKGL